MKLAVGILLFAGALFAHCDRMDGPVVKAAKRALETGNVNHVLIWVQARDEAAVREAFARARSNPAGRQQFFEAVVKAHRAGEGAPFEGVKPAGGDLGPAIPAADAAVERGSPEAVLEVLHHSIEHGVKQRLAALETARKFGTDDVAAGREYVRAYVDFLHYVEGVHQAAAAAAEHHH